MNRIVLFWLALIALTGCASTTTAVIVDPKTVRETSVRDVVRLASRQEVIRTDLQMVLYVLPPGSYFPVAEDAQGVFYWCISGLVSDLSQVPGADQPYMLHMGGVYLPNDPNVEATPWVVLDFGGYLAGKMKIDQETARRVGSQCAEMESHDSSSLNSAHSLPLIVVDVIPIGPGANKVTLGQKVGTNLATSAITTMISNAILSIDNGKIVQLQITPTSSASLRKAITRVEK